MCVVSADRRPPRLPDANAELFTARLRLRRIAETDIEAVVAISSDPETNRHRPGGPPSRADSERIARSFIEDWRRDGIGYWVVEHEGAIVGMTGVRRTRRASLDYWNLYYRFSPTVWGTGLAGEAVRMAIAVARREAPDRVILARTRPDNEAAARLALAVGLRRAPAFDDGGLIAYESAPSRDRRE